MRRTPLGFDSMDHMLDIVIEPDLSWRWKDEGQLAEAVSIGLVTQAWANEVRRKGERMIERLEARRPPFCDGWETWRPDPELPEDELGAWSWFSADELDDALPDYMARTRVALDAARSGSTAYLEWGRLPPSAQPREPYRPMLLLMKGPPGSGKSTIARELGRRLAWLVIDKDVFRDLLPDELGGLSYEAMLDLAERQLAIGLSVIADSPLGYGTGYRKALAIAARTDTKVAVVECGCSDPAEWRRRVEGRAGTGLPEHHATDWAKVEAFQARTAEDPYDVNVPIIRIDTVAAVEQSLRRVMDWLDSQASAGPAAR